MLDKRIKSIVPKDLLYVILYTLVLSIAPGILLGYLDYLVINSIGWSFIGFLYFGIAIYLGSTVRKSVEEPHLVYTIIAGIGMFLSWMIINAVPYFLFQGITLQEYQIFLDPVYYWRITLYELNPLNFLQGMAFFNYLISTLILVVGTVVGIQRTLH